MFHLDSGCNQKLIQLNDALCTFERATGREYTLVLVPHTPDEEVHISHSGKPLPVDSMRMSPTGVIEFAMQMRRDSMM